MTIDIRFCGLQGSDSLRTYIARRIHFQLRRIGAALMAVVVRLSDVNGPKGGADKRCQVMIRRAGRPPVTIEELSADAYTAVDLAVDRASRAAGRALARTRTRRRRWRASLGGAVA